MIPVELGAKAFWMVVAGGAVAGAVSLAVMRRGSNAAKLKIAMNHIWAHLLEFQLFADEPRLIFKAQRDLLIANGRMLRLVAVPSLVLLLPFAMLMVAADAVFGHAPLVPGGAAVVTVECGGCESGHLPAVEMQVPSGIRVETPPVRVPAEGQISWRVRAAVPSSGNLRISCCGHVFEKSISSKPGLQWLSERRSGSVPSFLLHPQELPLFGGALSFIEVKYPPATIFHTHWLVWFSLASIVGAGVSALRGRTRVALACFAALFFAGGFPADLQADTVSALFARGYTVIPEPRQVELEGNDFEVGSHWRLQVGRGIAADSVAVESLVEGLKSRHQIRLNGGREATRVLMLELAPGTITPGASQDADRDAIAAQAYRLELSPSRIHISANAAEGLFYGVQTLIQLLRARNGAVWLPKGEILDWPDLQLRQIYWDDAHHLEKLPELLRAVRQAAFFKINGFILKLEGHFQYRSAPALVEPQALSPTELQQLTDYGLRYHVQVIPYLDAPGHIAFILKHPEYAQFRAFAKSNYEMCTTNPAGLKLLYGMYDDLLAANKGVKYFYLSTDEAYYVGLSDENGCQEAQRNKALGSPGRVLAEFVSHAAGYLHDHGRSVVFWGELPLKPDDIQALPPYVINGETYGPAFDPIFKAHGIRQMMYGATEGEEHLFPHYFLRPPGKRIHPLYEDYERVPDALTKIVSEPARRTADLLGLTIAGWGDMGLHPETFWLGYATITACGWNPSTVDGHESMSSFYPLFYGAGVTGMDRVYQLMSDQAQIWTDSWDSIDSTARTPIWGNSNSIFQPPHPAHDQTIQLLPAPVGTDLRYKGNWTQENARRLAIVNDGLSENDELQGLLRANLRLADTNRYGLEVFLAIARLCRQNLDLLNGIAKIEEALQQADQASRSGEPPRALEHVDQALVQVQELWAQRNAVFQDAKTTWEKTWLPRVEEANGRRFLHEVDDVKDHLPDRTVDLSYLIYRELPLPFDTWYRQTESARNQYAKLHGLPVRNTLFDWKRYR